MAKGKVIEILGWIGAFLVVGVFALSNLNILPTTSIFYQILNIIGSILLTAISAKKKVWQGFVANLIWAIFSIIGMFIK